VGRAGDEDRGERIAINIGVVGQHARGGESGGRDVGTRVTVSGHDAARGARRIVGRGDGDGDGGVGGAVNLAVVGFVSEAVRAVVIERRGVSTTVPYTPLFRSVGRAGDEDRGERIAINIGVVGQHARSG